MREYTVNGSNMLTKSDAHAELASALEIKDYYGANLDALYDVLGGFRGRIRLINTVQMLNGLKGYGCKILKTLFDAASENEYITLIIE